MEPQKGSVEDFIKIMGMDKPEEVIEAIASELSKIVGHPITCTVCRKECPHTRTGEESNPSFREKRDDVKYS